MKKLLSLLAFVGVLGVAGCSCSKEGVYKFDSMTITEGEETTTYTCTEEEMEDMSIGFACSMFTSMQIKLDDDKMIMIPLDEDGKAMEDESEEAKYKIEDGKLMVKEEDSEEYVEFGTYKKGKLTLTSVFGEGVEVVFKKD